MKAIEREAVVLTGPWILYDGKCFMCRAGEVRLGPLMRRRGFRLATLKSPIGREFGKGDADEMKVITRKGDVIGGAEGFAYICRHVWWAMPIFWLWKVPPFRPLLQRLYSWIAANRHCFGGTCNLSSNRTAGA